MSVGTYLGTCHTSVSVCQISVSVSVPVSVAMSAGTCVGTCVCTRSSGMRQIERWGAGVENHFQEFNEPYAPS